MDTWTLEQAVALCKEVEAIAPLYGCHVALTGGCLYKEGERKDLDLLFYRIRQTAEIDANGLFGALSQTLGLHKVSGFGWCHKAEYGSKRVDMFFPEEVEGEYVSGEQTKEQVAAICAGTAPCPPHRTDRGRERGADDCRYRAAAA